MLRRTLTTSFAALLTALWAPHAGAQNFDSQQFQPANGANAAFSTEGARTTPHLKTAGGLMLNYTSRPLVVIERTDDGARLDSPIADQQFAVHGMVGIGLWDRLQLDLDVPIYLVNEGRLPAEYSAGGLGDVRLRLKGRILGGDEGFGLGVALDTSLPTGSPERYVGEPTLLLAPRAIVDYDFGALTVMLNAGARFRESATFGGNIDLSSALTFGLGAEVELMRGVLNLTGDLYGRSHFDDLFAPEDTPVEVLFGGKVIAAHGITITGGAGGGITRGAGASAFRMILGVGWAPRDTDYDNDGIPNHLDECPYEAEDFDGFEDEDGCPDLDNDRDGIPDAQDQCPNEPEDLDGFEDEDGCPDPDNDGDGIPDSEDQCPDEAEDLDGFEDEDGCPDPDNDGDGIPDSEDQCPNEAEDLDGFEDEDGCPDLDNDNDKIPDSEDQCPDEPGLPEDNGCPPAETKAVRDGAQIRILDKVFFETAKATIKEESFDLLRQVALVLRSNDDILKVEIAGHTDDRGSAANNLKLSQERADSVRQWLVDYGIAAERLVAQGYGEDTPLEPGRTEAARAANRRVEFNIVDPAPTQPEPEPQAEETQTPEQAPQVQEEP